MLLILQNLFCHSWANTKLLKLPANSIILHMLYLKSNQMG